MEELGHFILENFWQIMLVIALLRLNKVYGTAAIIFIIYVKYTMWVMIPLIMLAILNPSDIAVRIKAVKVQEQKNKNKTSTTDDPDYD